MRPTAFKPSRLPPLAAALLLLLGGNAWAARAQGFRRLTEEFRMHGKFHSKFLGNDRDVLVWLPPGYDPEAERRYPVLYMHDGGTVFVEWRIDEIVKPLIAAGEVEPLIIVLVDNGGSHEARFDEFTPTRPGSSRHGGKADLYGRMLVEELKPFIDAEYRTLTDAPNTGLGGTSLGGLVSLHLGLKRPDVFGKLAVMSPSVWWDERVILRGVKALASKPATRIWLDVGSEEGRQMSADAKDLRDALTKKGWVANSDLVFFEAKGGKHNEQSFKLRAAPMLKHLFPPRRTKD